MPNNKPDNTASANSLESEPVLDAQNMQLALDAMKRNSSIPQECYISGSNISSVGQRRSSHYDASESDIRSNYTTEQRDIVGENEKECCSCSLQ